MKHDYSSQWKKNAAPAIRASGQVMSQSDKDRLLGLLRGITENYSNADTNHVEFRNRTTKNAEVAIALIEALPVGVI